jgi:Ca2+-binding EF-hand superfamily protein
MKKIVLLGAAAAVIATPSLAQQERGGIHRGVGITRADVQSRISTQFARVDADRDGYVTQIEAEAFRGSVRGDRREARQDRREERFARLDANRDGQISRGEFFAPRQRGERAERPDQRAERRDERRADRAQRRGQRGRLFARLGERRFNRVDANKDGRISLAEATQLRLQAFDRADLNRDGRLTREERRSLRAGRQDRRG